MWSQVNMKNTVQTSPKSWSHNLVTSLHKADRSSLLTFFSHIELQRKPPWLQSQQMQLTLLSRHALARNNTTSLICVVIMSITEVQLKNILINHVLFSSIVLRQEVIWAKQVGWLIQLVIINTELRIATKLYWRIVLIEIVRALSYDPQVSYAIKKKEYHVIICKSTMLLRMVIIHQTCRKRHKGCFQWNISILEPTNRFVKEKEGTGREAHEAVCIDGTTYGREGGRKGVREGRREERREEGRNDRGKEWGEEGGKERGQKGGKRGREWERGMGSAQR